MPEFSHLCVLQLVPRWEVSPVPEFVVPFLVAAMFGLGFGESCAFVVISPPGWEWVLVLVLHQSHHVRSQILTLGAGVHLLLLVALLVVTVVREVGTRLEP